MNGSLAARRGAGNEVLELLMLTSKLMVNAVFKRREDSTYCRLDGSIAAVLITLVTSRCLSSVIWKASQALCTGKVCYQASTARGFPAVEEQRARV